MASLLCVCTDLPFLALGEGSFALQLHQSQKFQCTENPSTYNEALVRSWAVDVWKAFQAGRAIARGWRPRSSKSIHLEKNWGLSKAYQSALQ